MKDMDIKESWKEYFDKLFFNGHSSQVVEDEYAFRKIKLWFPVNDKFMWS